MSHTVSIILPTFNQLGFLRAAVASVQAQTFSDWELLIVDDGSAAATRDYLLELHHPPRIRILSLPHTGNPSLSRNTALREARGEFVAFLDADDVWVPAKLATQIARLRGCPQGRWSYSSFAEIDEQGAASKRLSRRTWRAIQGSIFAQVVTTEAFIRAPSVVVAERELLLEVGGFDEQQRFGDYDLWMRLALK